MTRLVARPRLEVLAFAALTVIGAVGPAAPARAQEPRGVAIMWTQQDTVQAFDVLSGRGHQVGTASGRISGTTYVDFQFVPTGPPASNALPITFHNKVIVTDMDGDQLFFDNDGSGLFHLGMPGDEFRGTGGPMRGTYVLTGATGKYADWKIGTTFDYRAIATNPSAPGSLGTVRVEVSYRSPNTK